LQWLRQLQDPTALVLALIVVLAELLLVLDLEPLALQELVQAPPPERSQCLPGLHQPAVLVLVQRPPPAKLAQHSHSGLEVHLASSTLPSAMLQIGLGWLTISQLSLLQGARRASQARYHCPSVGCLDNRTSFLLQQQAKLVTARHLVALGQLVSLLLLCSPLIDSVVPLLVAVVL
jgi:hypothetical protein